MIRIKIDEILKEKDKTIYWLSQKTGTSHNNLTNLIRGETRSINFDVLDKICLALDCEPGDIFDFKKINT
ncbi:MAG TPA: helix-turn-helix transcriptional regulator [Clostridia bacterium]|nr:helix-turn-helix transcriptional regulator [Clostridia bacterium]